MLTFENNADNLVDIVEKVKDFEMIENGKIKKIAHNDEQFKVLVDNLKTLFQSAQLMPAYCVSLHNETTLAMQTEKWLKINFTEEIVKNELPFSSLVFKLEKVIGFNLIRLFNNKYDGRCLYLNLNEETNLEDLFK